MHETSQSLQTISKRIMSLRGQKVLLDSDLAELYGVTTRRLNEQVRRNRERFPEDFIFEVSAAEFQSLMSQFATSNRGGRRKLPLAFTEHGAIMAASVLKTARAVEVSVYVVRAFVQLRELARSNEQLALRLEDLETKVQLLSLKHDSLEENARAQIQQIFHALRELMAQPSPPARRPIGFVTPEEKSQQPKSDSAKRAH